MSSEPRDALEIAYLIVPETLALQARDKLARQFVEKAPFLLTRPDGRPLTANDVVGLVQRAAERADARNNWPHMLRHTFVSHLAMRGAPIPAIQELAGHRDLTTAALHAPESGGRGECDSLAGIPRPAPGAWRHFGDGDQRDGKVNN
jgi:integrase